MYGHCELLRPQRGSVTPNGPVCGSPRTGPVVSTSSAVAAGRHLVLRRVAAPGLCTGQLTDSSGWRDTDARSHDRERRSSGRDMAIESTPTEPVLVIMGVSGGGKSTVAG